MRPAFVSVVFVAVVVVFQAYICFGAVSDGVVIVAVTLYSTADTAIQA